MSRLQEVEQLLGNNLKLIEEYSKRIAELANSVSALAYEKGYEQGRKSAQDEINRLREYIARQSEEEYE